MNQLTAPLQCNLTQFCSLFAMQIPFCGTSVNDYLLTQPDKMLTLTIAFGSEVAYMFGSLPSQRVVLFAPTDAAWEVAAGIMGVFSSPPPPSSFSFPRYFSSLALCMILVKRCVCDWCYYKLVRGPWPR